MPRRNTIRKFAEEGIYHIYNRGVEKRNIFMDDQDYAVFLHLLKYYLSPTDPRKVHPLLEFQNFSIIRPRPLTNLEKEIDLLAYCLMPNHFHLILKQHSKDGVTKLISKISTTYAMYFNKRYKRVGYLFQGPYRAAIVESESYLLHLSRYVHLNPQELTGGTPVNYAYSSYQNYLNLKHTTWVKTELILSYFKKAKNLSSFLNEYDSYQKFVENIPTNSQIVLGNITLE